MFLKIVYIATFVIWVAAIAIIATKDGGFEAQMPLCILSTMTIFGISTLLVKWYEKRGGKD